MKTKFTLLALGLGFALISGAHANLALTPDSPLHPADESPAGLEAFVRAQLGNPNLVDAIQVERSAGNFDNGMFQVVFNADKTATISFDLTGASFTGLALFVFGGSNGGNLYTVTADQMVIGGGTVQAPFTGNGNRIARISHIDFFIQPGGGNSVPDGGTTVILLGSALSCFALVRRFGMGTKWVSRRWSHS